MSYSEYHLFFDLDRTLWDFDKNSEIALKSIFQDVQNEMEGIGFYKFHGVYKIENAKLWKLYAKGQLEKERLRYLRFRNTLDHLNIYSESLVNFYGDEYVNRSPFQTNLIQDSKETLIELKKMGFNLHIITNGFKEVQYVKLENCGLKKFFSEIFCSEEIGYNKPDPKIYEFASKVTGSNKNNSIMIGDDYLADIHGSLSVGWKAIFFNPEKRKNYGFDCQFSDYKDFMPLLLKII